ncbi:MAG: ABC-2 transporter permease [Clostridiales bacterium]|nr:ABC-2 transporter permease [Clostridiales bacterium]
MKTLLYKQLRLACHPMTPVFCLSGIMLLIPNYPYSVAFFYVTLGLFFTFLNMREQKDIYYSALLPLRKRDTVRAAVAFTVLVELLSVVITALFCLLSAKLQPGKDNAVGMDANLMLLGAGFVLYGVFNLVFFICLYRSGYKVGAAYLKANLALWPMMLLAEALPHFPSLMWLNRVDVRANLRQIPILLFGIAVFAVLTILAYRRSARLYERVDL